jgi:hypothetical protein
MAQHDNALRDAVDNDRSLMPDLAQRLGWEPWMVNHIARHWPVFHEVDGWYSHHAWDLGALLVNWTPETAPRRLTPLKRLCSLFWYGAFAIPGIPGRSWFDPPKQVLSAHDRCTLLEILEDGTRFAQLCEYLNFLSSLEHWLSRRSGKAVGAILPRLLGANTIADWWILCMRWHRINEDLRGERPTTAMPTDAHSSGLLTEPVHRGLYSFHNLRNPLYRPRVWKRHDAYQEFPNAHAPRFPPCTVYVELDGIHHATLTVAIEGSADAPTIRVLETADRIHWTTLDVATQAAVDQFLAGCNAGQIPLKPQTVEFYRSRAALRVSLLDKFRRIDYPSWVQLFAEDEYFAAHTEMTGAALFDAYRESLGIVETTDASLYQLAVEAAQLAGEPDAEFIEIITDDK